MTRYRLHLQQHVFEVRVERRSEQWTIIVDRDGSEVGCVPQAFMATEIDLAQIDAGVDLEGLDAQGARIVVRAFRKGDIGGCVLLVPRENARPERLAFEPLHEGWKRRLYEFEQRHPRLFATRHVVVASMQVLATIVGFSLVFRWIPWDMIPLPNLPDIKPPNLPDLPLPNLPSIDLPDLTMPAWLLAMLHSRKYWLPVVIAIFIALAEVERRKKRNEKNQDPDGNTDENPSREDLRPEKPDNKKGNDS